MARGLSLHIGLNSVSPEHYAGWSGPLVACEADAEDMLDLAQARGFAASVLTTRDATRAAVSAALQRASEQLKAGDIFFVSYSGHGGQLPDFSGDELDNQDETWCLYDGALLDDELDAAWMRFERGVRVLVLSDSCHSGTVTKVLESPAAYRDARSGLRPHGAGESLEPQVRAMPAEVAFRTYRRNRALYSQLQKDSLPRQARERVKASVRLISGCQDNQVSLDGAFNGLFTGMLLRVWRDGRFKGTYAEFHKAIARLMPPTQTPNHLVVGTPSLEFDAQVPFAI